MKRFVLAALLAACGPGSRGGPNMGNHMNGPEAKPATSPVVTAEILAREPVANTAEVKHILIGWKDLEHIDARAKQRTKPEAEGQVKDVIETLQGGADFYALLKQYSDDTRRSA